MNDPGPVHGLTAENLLTVFPVALQGDRDAAALADVTARLLARRPEEIDRLRIYPAIGRLDGRLLDILAYDFKVDWWDADYNLEEKRRTLKDSWRVHKMLGTPAAVKTAIRAIYPQTDVEEWFQYEGGKPFHFKLHIDLTREIPVEGKLERVVERVGFYKSLRSHVDSIQYTIRFPEFSLRVGGGAGAQVRMGVPVEPDAYSFRDTLQVGGAFAGRTALSVPEDISQPPATTILRTGGVCTIISNLSGED